MRLCILTNITARKADRTAFYVERKCINEVARGVITLDAHEENLDDASTAEQNG